MQCPKCKAQMKLDEVMLGSEKWWYYWCTGCDVEFRTNKPDIYACTLTCLEDKNEVSAMHL